jgi:Ca2+-binding EF-hand superfamily protein
MAFKVFDHNNTGRCKATELREALMYYGEKMTEAEVQSHICRLKCVNATDNLLIIFYITVERYDYG